MTRRRRLLAAAGGAGASVAGLWIARLTLLLDPRLHSGLGDSLLLLAYLGAGFGLAGAAAGAAVGLVAETLGRAFRRRPTRSHSRRRPGGEAPPPRPGRWRWRRGSTPRCCRRPGSRDICSPLGSAGWRRGGSPR
jgi:hypothetical protein